VSLSPRPLRSLTVTYDPAELVAVALLAAAVAAWAAVAGGAFSFMVLVACEATFFALYLVGSLLAGWRGLAEGLLFDLPLRLLAGYVVLNTALLVLAWVSPLGIIANFALLVAVALALWFSAGERKSVPAARTSLLAVGLTVVATTLWCQDSISPVVDDGRSVLFKPWVDGFYHAVHIRIFGASHGASTIEDFRMAGIPARLYHYGVYFLPAFIKQVSGIHSYAAFAGILVPVGVLFTGLSAYAFFGSLWGRFSGLTAAMALLLLPDGAQQGMRNTFMSYHWLTQISPSAVYGLAVLAVAWLLVIQGSLRGSRAQVAAGFVTTCVLVIYKLHYVIASSLLLLLVPALFFRAPLGPKKRALSAVAACVVWFVALTVGQKVPGVPPLRFDGSGSGEILRLVQTFASPGAVKDFFIHRMGAEFPWSSNLLFGVPYVLFASLGLFVPLLVVLLVLMRKRVELLHVLFPALLVVNFLAMFFGLALDFTRSTPDELNHRPIMIVYFFVVTWVGAAAGVLLEGSRVSSRVLRPAAVGLAVLLLAVPARFGKGVQTLPAMARTSPVRAPLALLGVAEYLRTHGGPGDVFQDSQFDRVYAIGALAERRTFVSHTMTTMPLRADMVAVRTAAVDRLMGLTDPKLVLATARTFGLRWFVLQRGNRVNWPEDAIKPVFEAGPFRLYDLR
jgi:hypothetical protein